MHISYTEFMQLKKHVIVYKMAHIILPSTNNENIIDVIKD